MPRVVWDQIVLPRRLRSDGVDLFHARGYVSPVAARLPVVLSVYDLLAFDRPDLCRLGARWHCRALLPLSVRRARRIVVPSHSEQRDVMHRMPWAKDCIAVVLPGVDERLRVSHSADDLMEVRRLYELRDEFVLFVGCFEPKKNLARLIDAFRRARQRGDLSGELVLVGTREWGADSLRGESKEGICRLGYLPFEHLPSSGSLSVRAIARVSVLERGLWTTSDRRNGVRAAGCLLGRSGVARFRSGRSDPRRSSLRSGHLAGPGPGVA